MRKYFRLFLVFILIFGFVGTVFGGTFKSPSSTSSGQVVTNSDGSQIVKINGISFNVVKSTASTEVLYKNGNRYYDSNGFQVNPNGVYLGMVNNEPTELSTGPGVQILSYMSDAFKKRQNDIIQNPNLASNLEIKKLQSDGVTIDWKPLFTSLGTASTALTNCQKKTPKKCSKFETNLNKINEKINLNTDVTSILNSMTEKQQKIYIQNYNKDHSCNIGFGLDSVCNWMTSLNANDLALVSYKQKIANYQKSSDVIKLQQSIKDARKELSIAKSSCSKNPQSHKTCTSKINQNIKTAQANLDKAEKNYIDAFNAHQIEVAFSGLDEKTVKDFNCGSDPNACLDSVKKSKFCQNNANKAHCTQISSALNSAKDTKLVQTNAIFDIINALANPDQDALNAAKLLFGKLGGANYDNVPKMLRTSVSSQICAAKIGGYLDKTQTNSGGGVTSYGCDSAQSYNYDPNTGHSVNIEPNCRKVLLDFRAQRAQITPDNKVGITYSLYLKAPAKTNINYFIAVKYLLKDKSTKKQLLLADKNFSYTGVGGIAKEDSTIFLPLNVSRSLIDDSKSSFYLAILARYPGGNYYQFQSIPVVLMTGTDFYPGISAGNAAGAGSSSGTGSSNAALTPAGLLSLI